MSKAVNPSGAVSSFAGMLRPVEFRVDRNSKLSPRDQAMARARQEGHQAGYDEGFAQGYHEGRAEGHARAHAEAMAEHRDELTRFRAALENYAEEVPAALENWCAEAEPALTRLALAIAAKVTGESLRTDHEAVLTHVRTALREVTSARTARIRLNPAASSWVASYRDELIEAGSTLRNVEVVRDPNLGVGVMIETDAGVIDARVDVMLREALEDLRRAE